MKFPKLKLPTLTQSNINTICLFGVAIGLLLALFAYFHRIKEIEGFGGDWKLTTKGHDCSLERLGQPLFLFRSNGTMDNGTIRVLNESIERIKSKLGQCTETMDIAEGEKSEEELNAEEGAKKEAEGGFSQFEGVCRDGAGKFPSFTQTYGKDGDQLKAMCKPNSLCQGYAVGTAGHPEFAKKVGHLYFTSGGEQQASSPGTYITKGDKEADSNYACFVKGGIN